MKRTKLQAVCLLAATIFFSLKAHSQTTQTGMPLPGNNEIILEQFEWHNIPGKDTPKVAVRFTLRNLSGDKPIRSARFTLIAKDKNGVMLMEGGSALHQLSGQETITPGTSGTFSFPAAYTIRGVDQVVLKEVYVTFSNGSLSILKEL
ncbi:hypothetical protein [Taibaiella koreensis]|uniref:hypothetical protein n=1 Tax=Taibaiella koreensis TaxID=1268548 RepID=UPI0013C2E6EB|nr:hypothetical protein [Taibaiella koreensis]